MLCFVGGDLGYCCGEFGLCGGELVGCVEVSVG